MSNGFVIYEGASSLDPQIEIAVIAILKSANGKTGNMIQTYILVKDTDPRYANKSGLDFAICGDCIHRGRPSNNPDKKLAEGRTCYVNIGQGVLIVWKQYQKGAYPYLSGHEDIAQLGAGQIVRLGTYGDPSAAPSFIWESLLSLAKGRTGYTHQLGVSGADVRPDLCMISADTYEQALYAWGQGYRTFRTVPILESKEKTLAQIDRKNETLCPASEEAGYRTTCKDCKLCSGSGIKAKNIVIPMHDTKSVSAKRRQNLQMKGA